MALRGAKSQLAEALTWGRPAVIPSCKYGVVGGQEGKPAKTLTQGRPAVIPTCKYGIVGSQESQPAKTLTGPSCHHSLMSVT